MTAASAATPNIPLNWTEPAMLPDETTGIEMDEVDEVEDDEVVIVVSTEEVVGAAEDVVGAAEEVVNSTEEVVGATDDEVDSTVDDGLAEEVDSTEEVDKVDGSADEDEDEDKEDEAEEEEADEDAEDEALTPASEQTLLNAAKAVPEVPSGQEDSRHDCIDEYSEEQTQLISFNWLQVDEDLTTFDAHANKHAGGVAAEGAI